MTKKRAIVDIESGEIIHNIDSGDRIIRGNSIKYLKDKRNDKSFTKIVHNKQYYQIIRNEPRCIPLLLFLILNCRYDNSITLNNGDIIDNIYLAEYFSTSERHIRRLIKPLKQYNILYKSQKIYYFNPDFVNKGRKNGP